MRIQVTQVQKEAIVRRLLADGMTRQELAAALGGATDAAARGWLLREVKRIYPVISTRGRRGYIIASTPEHLELAKSASRENHRKAATLHKSTNVLDRWIIRTESAAQGASLFEEEIKDINKNI